MNPDRVALLCNTLAHVLEEVAKLPNPGQVLDVHAQGFRRFALGLVELADRHKVASDWTLTDLRERVDELERRARVAAARESGYSSTPNPPPPSDGDPPPE